MKILLTLFVLFFSSSVVAADFISDYQIEGISIGDSMLDHFSKGDMENVSTYFLKDNKYMYYVFYKFPTVKTFEGIKVTVKPHDKKYIIFGVEGFLDFKYDIEDCYKKQEEIKKELDKIFKTDAIKDFDKHPVDPTGNSTYTRYSYFYSNSKFADVELNCYYAGKEYREKGHSHSLYVVLTTQEFNTFLFYEHYE